MTYASSSHKFPRIVVLTEETLSCPACHEVSLAFLISQKIHPIIEKISASLFRVYILKHLHSKIPVRLVRYFGK